MPDRKAGPKGLASTKASAAATSGDVARLDLFFANHNANRHLALYRREPDARLLFRASREYVVAGVAAPERLLHLLRKAEAALEGKHTPKSFRAAMGMRLSSPREFARLLRRRDIVEQYVILTAELKVKSMEAMRLVAAGFGENVGNVARILSQWGALSQPARSDRSKRAQGGAAHLQTYLSTQRRS